MLLAAEKENSGVGPRENGMVLKTARAETLIKIAHVQRAEKG
jgi:hypothetical protein